MNLSAKLNASDLNGSGIIEHNGCLFLGYNLISPGQGIYRHCGATGVEDLVRQPLRAYPNPGEDAVTVEYPAEFIGGSFNLLDQRGAAVMNGRISGMRMELDLHGRAGGVYVLNVVGGAPAPMRLVKH